jgi:glycosyltransferase involved in cell wall biosynthesis
MATHNFYTQIYKVGDSHLADAFVGMGHQVLYLSGPINVFRTRHIVDRGTIGKEYRRAFMTWLRGGVYHKDDLLEYHPLALLPISRRMPFGNTNLALFRNVTLTFPPLNQYIKKHGFAHPDVLLVSQLQMAELLDRVDAKVKILRLTDDIPSFKSVPDEIRLLENYAVERADIVAVTSVVLKERLGNIRKDIVYIPNAVDYDFYHSADRSIPPEYKGMKGPIVIYIGAIDYWFDVDLVAYLARLYPKVNFVIIGIPKISMDSLSELNNVYILGPRPYSQLPRYLWNAAVGVIPFKNDPVVDAISPLKLYEYSACGLPVITTRWKELEAIKSPVLLTGTYSEFADRLLEVLNSSGSAQQEMRKISIKFAAENTWTTRANELIKIAQKKCERD